MLFLVCCFFPGSHVLSKVVAGAGAIPFGFVIVYDTQQIFSSASASFGGGKQDSAYTLDMYALVAWNLYRRRVGGQQPLDGWMSLMASDLKSVP